MKKTLLSLIALFIATIAFAQTQIDGIYYNLDNKNKTAEVTYDGNYRDSNGAGYTQTEIAIPSSVTYEDNTYNVTSIGEYAFYECTSLTAIAIPNGVTSIGEEAFYECTSLTAIAIPNGVTTIRGYAFEDCSALASITLPNSVTYIGERAFNGTAWLDNQPDGCVYIGNFLYKYKGEMPENTHIDVREGTIQICGEAFVVKPLSSITIPSSVTTIGLLSFYGCESLTSITIPNGVTSIEAEAFEDCISLASITLPNSVTHIGEWAFSGTAWYNNQPDGCLYLNNLLYTYKGEMPENTHIDVKEGTAVIVGGAFNGCSSLASITIPNSVTYIGGAFGYCSSLTSITIPNGVTSIEWWTFRGCSSLTSITLGSGITSINETAFESCSSLSLIEILAQTPPTVERYPYASRPDTIKVPCRAMADYQAADYWKDFTNYIADPYTFTVLSGDETMGSVEIIKQATCEDVTAQIEAKPLEGYEFVKWSDDNTENPRYIDVTSDTTITAVFRVATSTSIENTNNSQYKIYASNNTIYFENVETDYQIHTTTGQLIYTGNDAAVTLSRGIYIVTIEGKTEKIVL